MTRIFLFFSAALLFAGGAVAQDAPKEKVAVYTTDKSDKNVASFVGTYLTDAIVKRGKYAAVERTSDFLRVLSKEQSYQRTGAVDDNQISALGKQFGVQLVCVVEVSTIGDGQLFMSARLVDVQSATIKATARPVRFNGDDYDAIERSCEDITASMFDPLGSRVGTSSVGRSSTYGSTPRVSTPATKPAVPAKAPAAPTPMYKVGDTGPAGGIVFYDKGSVSNGWRYLEVAPVSTEKILGWCAGNSIKVENTDAGLGSGKKNTELIVAVFTENGLSGAATYCEDMLCNGFTDWFLPSVAELALMYRVLKGNKLGDFKSEGYWSSSYNSGSSSSWLSYSYFVNFSDGSRKSDSQSRTYNVRAIRQF